MQDDVAGPGLGRCGLPTVETAEEHFKWAVLVMGDDSVVFWMVVGDDVTVSEDLITQGLDSETEDSNQLTLTIPDGAVIPDGGVVVTDMAILQGALSNTPQRMPNTGIVEMKTLEEMHDY